MFVGPVRCPVTFIEETGLGCNLPKEKPADGDFNGQDTERGFPVVWVSFEKNVSFNLKQSHNIGKQYGPKDQTSCITTYI